jgi:hypothetical protein
MMSEPIVWLNRNPDKERCPVEACASYGLPGFMGRPGHIVNIKVPWWVRLLPFWQPWKNLAIDMKALYKANNDKWPPKPDPHLEDTSQFLEIQLY